MELILSIEVEIDDCIVVKNRETEIRFILFHGSASSDYFRGTVLPGGVDTQFCSGDPIMVSLSARYILEGIDYTGEKCRIFIENNGCDTGDGIRTTPKIITDSKVLQRLLDDELIGDVVGSDGVVNIRIYRKENNRLVELK